MKYLLFNVISDLSKLQQWLDNDEMSCDLIKDKIGIVKKHYLLYATSFEKDVIEKSFWNDEEGVYRANDGKYYMKKEWCGYETSDGKDVPYGYDMIATELFMTIDDIMDYSGGIMVKW